MATHFCNMANKTTPMQSKLIANELEPRELELQTSSSIFKDVTLKKLYFLHVTNIVIHSSALQQIYEVWIIDILSRMDRKAAAKM